MILVQSVSFAECTPKPSREGWKLGSHPPGSGVFWEPLRLSWSLTLGQIKFARGPITAAVSLTPSPRNPALHLSILSDNFYSI